VTPEPVSAEGSCRLHRQLAAAPGSESPPTTLSNVVQGGRDPSAAADASSATKRKSLPSSTALLVMTRKGTVSALPREPNSTHSLLSVHTRSQLEVRALSRLAANAELTPPRQAVMCLLATSKQGRSQTAAHGRKRACQRPGRPESCSSSRWGRVAFAAAFCARAGARVATPGTCVGASGRRLLRGASRAREPLHSRAGGQQIAAVVNAAVSKTGFGSFRSDEGSNPSPSAGRSERSA
jgi:hypothetical protein